MRILNLTTQPSASFPDGVTITLYGNVPPKTGKRPTKFANNPQKRKLMGSTYHQNKERTRQEELARGST